MRRWLQLFIILYYIFFKGIVAHNNIETPKNITKHPPCKACRIFIESFRKGIDRTTNYKFEGGDTAWEEEKLGSYATSEVRFIEILEKLCSELKDDKDQCYQLLEELEESLEEWWFTKQFTEPDLFKAICIEDSKVCCPSLHYGKDCTPCPGFPDNICNKNGKCKGSGTRKGDGKCHCDIGYGGDFCDSCANDYYKSYKDENKLLCSPCHESCLEGCKEAGPAGCKFCKSGWIKDEERGCIDINECEAKKSPCSPLQFCVNTNGGYKCLDCDVSCAGCTGDGPDMCIECASQYFRKDNFCIDSSEENRKKVAFFTRYLTYLGLCIATYIILNKNTYIAAIVGSCVAIYISISEYTLNWKVVPNANLEKQLSDHVMKAFSNH
ncbi:cysteine-rich with EGF-like domain protein 2 [Diorhabda carinulata]|uniref:cysteine-rich with EGF-like domain protein 2 n=1 Tax=Diorhabda carinulata TaxID=1163345 RepID=UPI0025A07BA9|nr:cysteine-rich with EGF-like domain protein 2 [Diorhabda carinulata]XP_057664709.1 cysteine-rich with EGF-like domain protein 2 [Diorhabda carinulata]